MILLIGDNHGRFRHVLDAIVRSRVRHGCDLRTLFSSATSKPSVVQTEIAPILALGVEVTTGSSATTIRTAETGTICRDRCTVAWMAE